MLEIYALPGHLIRRAGQISSALFTEECRELDITPVQYASLVAIEAHPDVDATRLSSLIAFDRSTLGDVLERLEAKGWVARVAGREDRRVKRLKLTAKGAATLARARPAVQRAQERLMEPLSPKDRVVMLRLLTRLAHVHNDATTASLESPDRSYGEG
jgi:DNA-binding MarR family transcriptional regulator